MSYSLSRASAAKRNETRDPAQDSRSAVLSSEGTVPVAPGSRLSLRSAGTRIIAGRFRSIFNPIRRWQPRSYLTAAVTDAAVCPNRIARSSGVRMPPAFGLTSLALA
jgi:hypothetical protein